jgi:broad specificity phosphatase PhoE
MAIFYLIRHGRTDWNVARRVMGRSDVPLNETGRGQVDDLGRSMARFPLDKIFSSPQLRARETAEAVASPHGLPVEIEPALAEVDFGSWVGRNYEELLSDPDYRLWLDRPDSAEAPRCESSRAVRDRTVELLERLEQRDPNGSFALVSHADPIRAMINYVLNAPVEEFRRVRIANGSLSVALKERQKWKLTLLNYRPEPDLRAEL